jgi:hypothetical protein
LQPSAGRSVHRAQGSTLERVVVDLSQRKTRKVPHLHYVALSRVRSLEKLQILNFNEQALDVDEQVQKEMQRLHQDAVLKVDLSPFQSINSSALFKLAFHNCRSLHLHFDDVKCDKNLTLSHVFGLAETRLHEHDDSFDFEINGFQLIRNDQVGGSRVKRPAHGLAVYVQNDTLITREMKFSSKTLEFVLLNILHELIEMQVLFLYKSPNMPDKDLVSCLNEKLIPHLNLSEPLVIMGDFNIDCSKRNTGVLKKLEDIFSCRMLIDEPTTDYISVLDLVFSNTNGKVGTFETYWSDHKIIFWHT